MIRLRLLDDDEDERAGGRDDGAADRTPDGCPDGFAVLERREIHNAGRYRAVIENLDFMWRWRIYRDGEMRQEGCSLSDSSSCEAVRHVLAFYEICDGGAATADVPARES